MKNRDKQPTHLMTIYDKPSFGRFHSPFNLTAQPMERLLLIDFKGDPLVKCIELQEFDDPLHGKGLLVILYRQARIQVEGSELTTLPHWTRT